MLDCFICFDLGLGAVFVGFSGCQFYANLVRILE
jgi:hypothetical protein